MAVPAEREDSCGATDATQWLRFQSATWWFFGELALDTRLIIIVSPLTRADRSAFIAIRAESPTILAIVGKKVSVARFEAVCVIAKILGSGYLAEKEA